MKYTNEQTMEAVIKLLEGKKIILENGETTPTIARASFTKNHIRLDFDEDTQDGNRTMYLRETNAVTLL